MLAGWVHVNGRQIQLEPSDAIVVLGASQFDGDPSPVFANRLDRALEVSLLGVSDQIITVGGKQPGDRFTEASAGRDYLIDSGLKPKKIEAIPTGSDTVSSLQAVAVYLNKISAETVTVVSDPAHVTRSKIILEKLGFEVFLAPTLNGPGSEFKLEYQLREVAGILHFWLIDQWGIDATAR
jgi:uncharacterized SAM-binding protein YcdF (DUF218 family)